MELNNSEGLAGQTDVSIKQDTYQKYNSDISVNGLDLLIVVLAIAVVVSWFHKPKDTE